MISLVWANRCKDLVILLDYPRRSSSIDVEVPAIGDQVETPKGTALVKNVFFKADTAINYITLEFKSGKIETHRLFAEELFA